MNSPPFNIIKLSSNSAAFALSTELLSTSFSTVVIKLLRFEVKVFFLDSCLVKSNNHISIFASLATPTIFLYNISD